MSKLPANFQKAIDLFEKKEWKAALALFLKIDAHIENEELQAELAYYMGLCYAKLNRLDDALLYLEQVITLGSDPLRIYQCRMALAYVYAVTGRTRHAEFELQKLLESGYESPQMYATLGYTAWAQKRAESAIVFYENALKLDANNSNAINGLGYILCDSEIDIPRGMGLCRQAVDLQPQNPAYLDSLGWAFYKSGNIVKAQEWLKKAVKLAPTVEEIKEHYKVVLGGKR